MRMHRVVLVLSVLVTGCRDHAPESAVSACRARCAEMRLSDQQATSACTSECVGIAAGTR